jgi:hypothetical protein
LSARLCAGSQSNLTAKLKQRLREVAKGATILAGAIGPLAPLKMLVRASCRSSKNNWDQGGNSHPSTQGG